MSKTPEEEDTSWILFIEYDSHWLSILNSINTNTETLKIGSIVFTFSTTISITSRADAYDKAPLIISFSPQRNVTNYQNVSYPEAANEGRVAASFVHTHQFIERCYLMEDWTTWIMVTFIVWGTLAVLHFAWSWILYRQYSIYLQKVILFIPLFFIIDNLIDYVYWKACPWVSASGENIRYL